MTTFGAGIPQGEVDAVHAHAAVPVPFADAASPGRPHSGRQHPDRRAQPTRMWSRHALLGGRRRTVRRTEEREGAFVDVHGPRMLLLVLVILGLNLLDAWFTLLFLSYGGKELNPLVQAVLDLGGHPWPFVLLKTVGIGTACAFLTMTKHFRPARIGLWIVLVGYSALLGWHLVLLSWLEAA